MMWPLALGYALQHEVLCIVQRNPKGEAHDQHQDQPGHQAGVHRVDARHAVPGAQEEAPPPTPTDVCGASRCADVQGGESRARQSGAAGAEARCCMNIPAPILKLLHDEPAPVQESAAQHVRNCIQLLLLAEARRSVEHTSELQSLTNLVCRLLLEKK